ncbi:hypothetical protein SUGI_0181170 [Cryptomeria japonica]|nr:hypothetical protein SUGI_0181170 [Cryptomeria japonica]
MDITNIAFVKVSDDFKVESPFSAPPPPKKRKERKGKMLVATGIILMDFSSSLLIVAFLVVCLGGLKLHMMRKITLQIMVLEGLKAFSYKEIEAAMSGFREELGRGSFGKVCKGCLDDGRVIVVKILDDKAVQEKHGGACLV